MRAIISCDWQGDNDVICRPNGHGYTPPPLLSCEVQMMIGWPATPVKYPGGPRFAGHGTLGFEDSSRWRQLPR